MSEEAKIAFDGTAALDLAPTLVESSRPRTDQKLPNKESDFPFAVTVGDVYEGPLDLLLHLIRKQDIDIYDIPIGKITAQYLAHVEKLRELAAEARQSFAIRTVALVHRLGRLEIGDSSVLIAVFSGHRAAAFDACRWLIDTLKRTVPIWKKEIYEGGEEWVATDSTDK